MYENLYVRMNVVREELFFAQRKVKELKKEMAKLRGNMSKLRKLDKKLDVLYNQREKVLFSNLKKKKEEVEEVEEVVSTLRSVPRGPEDVILDNYDSSVPDDNLPETKPVLNKGQSSIRKPSNFEGSFIFNPHERKSIEVDNIPY